MPDPSISDEDVVRVTRSYLDRMHREPLPRDIEGDVMRSIREPRRRRSISVARLVAAGLMFAAIAAVACLALVMHFGRSSIGGASAHWTIVSTSNSPSGSSGLSAVTCVSPGDCWAAGYSYGQNGNTQPLIEQNSGTGWTVVASPNPSVSRSDALRGLACVGAGDCWAVGYSIDVSDGIGQALIEHYAGSGWSIFSSPKPSGVTDTRLSGVTCVSADDCWAVGQSGQGGLIEHFQGSSWSIASSPTTSSGVGGALYAVTCVSAGDCWAVGGSATGALIEHFGASGWSTFSPNASAGENAVLQAVTCAGAGDCWAAGVSLTATSSTKTLIEQYQGSGWSVVASPNPADGSGPQLNSVSCDGAGDCWAVGWFRAGAATAPGLLDTLIEEDQGSGWSIAPSPNLSGGSDTQLQAVTCVNAGSCWAVGYPGGAAGQVVMQLADPAVG